MTQSHDVLIVGGGINGAAIAREAALNGLPMLLVEKTTPPGATSSASTKLIHSGLRCLEDIPVDRPKDAVIDIGEIANGRGYPKMQSCVAARSGSI